jgi:hypothetical protein
VRPPTRRSSILTQIAYRLHLWHSDVLTYWSLQHGTPARLAKALGVSVTTVSHGSPSRGDETERYLRATLPLSRIETLVSIDVHTKQAWMLGDEENAVQARFLGAFTVYAGEKHRVFLRVTRNGRTTTL